MPKKISRTGTALALCGVAALALTACDTTTTLKINEDGSAAFVLDLSDDTGALTALYSDCHELLGEVEGFTGSSTDELNATVEDLSSADNFHCLVSFASNDAAVDGETLIADGDFFTLMFEDSGEDVSTQDLAALEEYGTFTFNVEMPGEIVEAPDASRIDGNVATFDSLSILSSGITVKGYKTADGSAALPSSPTAEPSSATEENSQAEPLVDHDGEDSGLATPLLIGIGTLLLVAIVGVVFLITRKKDDDESAYAQYGYAAQQPPAPQSRPDQVNQANSDTQP